MIKAVTVLGVVLCSAFTSQPVKEKPQYRLRENSTVSGIPQSGCDQLLRNGKIDHSTFDLVISTAGSANKIEHYHCMDSILVKTQYHRDLSKRDCFEKDSLFVDWTHDYTIDSIRTDFLHVNGFYEVMHYGGGTCAQYKIVTLYVGGELKCRVYYDTVLGTNSALPVFSIIKKLTDLIEECESLTEAILPEK
jgi:hypothetical protein